MILKNKLKIILALLLVGVATLSFVSCNIESGQTGSPTNGNTQKKEILLYSDDNFKISFIDFKDPKAGVTSYNLYLKIENNSDKAVVVSPSDGYANDEAVFLGSGMPVKIAPSKKATGVFVVGYGNTSIKNIDDIKTLEFKITLYDESWSHKLLETKTLTIKFD